jgi:hypothetical protein
MKTCFDNHLYFTILALILIFSGMCYSRKMTDYAGPVFPVDHALNMPINDLPVHPNSANFINTIGANTALHPDFGTSWSDGGVDYQMGIPYNIVGANQPKVPITFVLYDEESDPGPWPIPTNPFIETVFDWHDETDGDRHMLIIDTSTHILYETGNVIGNTTGTSWEGGCGAIFDLNGYALRTEEWTSADAAGLPIFPLLIRYDEVEQALSVNGEFHHAIRFTVSQSKQEYIWPARHYASGSTDANRAPMGLRFRLKADFDISGFTPRMQVILRTMKKYGLIVADNGSNWYFQGTHDERWNDEEINSLKAIRGKNFEAVDISSWMKRPGFDKNSAKVPPATGSSINGSLPEKFRDASSIIVQNKNSGNRVIMSIELPQQSKILISAFDISGKKICDIFSGSVKMGKSEILWDASDGALGMVYIVQLRNDRGELSRCLVRRL